MVMSRVDNEGFLLDATTWTCNHARRSAEKHNLSLTSDHWKVINAVRNFYEETGVSPSMRPLVSLIRKTNPHLGNSLILAQLFTGQTSRVIAQVSGIPKPSDCL